MFSLPTHPRTGLRAIGVLPSGRIVWPVIGAEDPPNDPPPDPKPDPKPDPAPEPKPADYKAPKSQAELDQLVEDRLARERKKFADYEALKAKASKLDEIEKANQSDLEKVQQKADELESKARDATQRAVRAEVRALADDFADRDDAALNLGDLTKYVGDDGDIDLKAIKAELKSVLERKPHLKKSGPPPPNPRGRPVPDLKPGGDPNNPPKAGRLEDALAAFYNET